ncbi:MAG: MarC family protein [Oscillatoria princeps RMCB-10]|nr:MarC family protein [Oscillatoria princeps RMCB-10]
MISLLLKDFLALFAVIDPIGLAPLFITIAGHHSLEEQSRIAGRSVLVAASILLGFILGGNFLLRYLNISIEAFQVAGGVLLFKLAVDMVFNAPEPQTEAEEKEAEKQGDVSVFPLAIPLIAGPGTLASIIILDNEAAAYYFGQVMILAGALVVLLIAYVLMCLSGRLAQLLGQTGINVVTRVLGVLLSAMAVQYIANGAVVLLKNAPVGL